MLHHARSLLSKLEVKLHTTMYPLWDTRAAVEKSPVTWGKGSKWGDGGMGGVWGRGALLAAQRL